MNEKMTRRGDLEVALQVARGRVAQMREALENEQAGVYQIEGRLMEAEESEGRVTELELMIDPEILAAHDKEKD